MKAGILGVGAYVPEKILTNYDLEKMVDTNDEWITTRTGIKERRISAPEEASSDLGYKAALEALEKSNTKVEEIELIIVSTLAPDMLFPATACLIQEKLNAKNAVAFDVVGACTGFIYAMSIAKQFIENNCFKKVLVIAAECCSRLIDWTDRSTCVLFGDAGAAVVLGATRNKGIIDIDIHSDGKLHNILNVPAGGSRMPATEETVKNKLHSLKMLGPEVYKAAVKNMNKSVKDLLEKSNIDSENLDFFIPHQANLRIIDSVRKRLKLPKEKVLVNLDKYGNTSSATIPLGLYEAINLKRVKKGDLIIASAAGAGFTYGSILFYL